MSASTFTVYSSSDPGNGSDQPGLMFGAAGDLLRVLDKCLVNGYTGKAAAGWTKPFVNSSNSGCYKQGAGSLFALHIQDNGANVTSTFKEAWATGWETITAVSATVGTGTGQFPTPAQLLTTGHVVVRKSNTADSTNGRAWILFADSSTFYLFISTGDTAGIYYAFWFGDVFSLKGTTDAFRCMIRSGSTENSSANTSHTEDSLNIASASNVGSFMARGFGGGGTSITINGMGNLSFTAGAIPNVPMVGIIPTPNGPDNSFYLSPVFLAETSNNTIRGRFRGVYHVCHPIANFSDGQTFQGSNDFAGKSFQIVLKGPSSGYWAMETSATVETN